MHHDHGRTFGRPRPLPPSPTQAAFRIHPCGSRLPARPASHGTEKPSLMGHSERSRGTPCRCPTRTDKDPRAVVRLGWDVQAAEADLCSL
jgi:hypothetical protein